MFKKLWEKFLDCIFTSYGIDIDFEVTRLFIGIVLGAILTMLTLLTYVD